MVMSEPSAIAPSSDGFFWAGDLATVRVNAVYAACHALRFTGRLELKDDHHAALVTFLGGDPTEIEGGDTKVISLWNAGQFRAVQSLPNLTGELTGQIEQTGSLAITKAPRLLAWVSEYRLTCDLKIERPGENAVLVFRNGQLESADVNGKPELSALARVQGWSDGFYRVSLRPLFHTGVISLTPPPSDKAAPMGRDFDLSRSIPLDLKVRAQLQATPVGLVAFGHVPPEAITAERAAQQRPQMARMPGTDPALEALPRPSAAAATTGPAATPRRGARWPWVVLVLALLAGGGLGAAFYLHLPPFSAPPRPIDEPVEKAEPVEKVAPVEKTEPVEKAEPGRKAIDPATLAPKTGPRDADLPVQAPLDVRLIEKGRALLIDGHPHSALALFRKAEQTNPRNALAKTLQQQAMGKLGRAELVVDGRGGLVIDGRRIDAPRKLKVFAGPHAVDAGGGPEELVLKKNERHHLRAHP